MPAAPLHSTRPPLDAPGRVTHAAPATLAGLASGPALGARVATLAAGLAAAGVRPEEAVLVGPHAAAETCALILAVARCGALAVPLRAGLPAARQAEVAALSRARLGVFADPAQAPHGPRKTCTLDDLSAIPAQPPAHTPQAGDGALALYGAAGQGAVFSHTALAHGARALAQRYGLSPADRVLPMAPTGAADWLIWALAAAAAGARLLDAPKADPDDLIDVLAALRPTLLSLPDPRQALALIQDEGFRAADFAALRALHTNGPADLLRRLREDLPQTRLIHGYAPELAAGLPVCTDPRDPPATGETTCGRPLPGVEVMIVDPVTGRDMLLYEIGEIWLRGVPVFSGFLHSPAAAAGVLQPDGFLRTGDLGYLDREGRIVRA